MAIFTGTTRTSYGYDPAFESYGNVVTGGMDALIEGFSDELAVIEAMHAFDMAEIELHKSLKSIREAKEADEIDEDEAEEKEEKAEEAYVVTTEATLKEIWAKIKAWFKNLWEKVKAFFAGLIRNITAFFMTPKQFLKTYRDRLNKVSDIKFTVQTYSYKNLMSAMREVSAGAVQALSAADKSLEAQIKPLDDLAKAQGAANFDEKFADAKENFDKINDELMDEAIKAFCKETSGNADPDDYSENLRTYLRGSEEPEEITVTSIKSYITLIENSDAFIASIKKIDAEINKAMDKVTKEIAKREKESGNLEAYYEKALKADAKESGEKHSAKQYKNAAAWSAAVMRQTISNVNKLHSKIHTFVSVTVSVTKEACGVAKAILNKSLSPKAKKA